MKENNVGIYTDRVVCMCVYVCVVMGSEEVQKSCRRKQEKVVVRMNFFFDTVRTILLKSSNGRHINMHWNKRKKLLGLKSLLKRFVVTDRRDSTDFSIVVVLQLHQEQQRFFLLKRSIPLDIRQTERLLTFWNAPINYWQ